MSMPRYACKKCRHEFWGWGVHYAFKSGNWLACPDCRGTLVEKKEKNPLSLVARRPIKKVA